MKCDNCGKEKCDCGKYEKEIQELKSRFVAKSPEDILRLAAETVKRWKEKGSPKRKP